MDTATNEDIITTHPEAAGGGNTHIALKLLASKYLTSKNIKADYEQPFCGYYPDLLSKDNKLVVECGHTDNVDKIFEYFTQGNLETLIQIPYPDEIDTEIVAHTFESQPELKEFLEYSKKEALDSVKKLIKRR